MLQHFDIQVPDHYYQVYKKINLNVWQSYERGEIDHVQLRTSRFEKFTKHFDVKANPHEMSQHYLEQLVVHYEFLPGAKETLLELNGHYQLVYITNGLADVQRPRLEQSGIEALFESIIIADEIGHQKPHAAYFEQTLSTVNHPEKAKILVIGDNLTTDIQGGKNYGLDTCWLNQDQRNNHTSIIPTYEIQTLSELKSLLL